MTTPVAVLRVDQKGYIVPPAVESALLLAKNGVLGFTRLRVAGYPFLEITMLVGMYPPLYRDSTLQWFRTGVRNLQKKIPWKLFKEVTGFFQAVYDSEVTPGSEAMVMVYLNPRDRKWLCRPPKQLVSPGHLGWENHEPSPPGFYLVGSIHSHGTMHAGHSSTDDTDEYHWPGIHITVGCLDSFLDYAASMVIGKERYRVDIGDLIGSPPSVKSLVPKGWLDRVSPEPMLEEKIDTVPLNSVSPNGIVASTQREAKAHGSPL